MVNSDLCDLKYDNVYVIGDVFVFMDIEFGCLFLIIV